MLAARLNGVACQDEHALSVQDRGLAYGDGVFETMLLRAGEIRFVADHLQRLRLGCERLGIDPPSKQTLLGELAIVAKSYRDGVVKMIVTRGATARGYRAARDLQPTHLTLLFPAVTDDNRMLTVRWCNTRLARNAQLAGIKHLNRLEQVLARNEWQDNAIDEGLMMDTEGEVVCATAANLFAVLDQVLVTPDLRFCGVRGIVRQQILAAAAQLGVAVEERALWPDELAAASELFVSNAIRGIRSIAALGDQHWRGGPIADTLRTRLRL
jgi:4-amino-4-deoxychorismate lyase